jgi:chromosome segregation protein
MLLKRVEIFGFKSFPQKTVFSFNQGITAIVGPNGGGKSNLVDAIKWVLGEQSVKSLRGLKMQDVIFNGSFDVKSLSIAEVSLILDNSKSVFPLEFTEITITRRLYRSGESEYYINKSLCRLKDITELLMDTGLGADNYSVIEQGRINEILSSSPEERRLLFEEAAGITKYKSRKKEALRKLDRTEQNLLRLKDIIFEVQKQMRSLQSQASKAKRYKKFKEELKDLDIYLAKENYLELEQIYETRKKETKNININEQEAANEISLIEARIEEKKLEILKIENILKNKQEEFNKLNTEVELNKKQIDFNKHRINEIDLKETSSHSELKHIDERIKSFGVDIEENQNQHQVVLSNLENKNKAIEEKEKSINLFNNIIDEKIDEINKITQSMKVLFKEKYEIKNKNEYLQNITKDSEEKIKKINQELNIKKSENEVLEKKIVEIKRDLEKDKILLDEFELKRKNLNSKQKQIEDIIFSFNNEISALKSNILSLESKKNMLIEMKNNFEGYFEGVKHILQAKAGGNEKFKGIISDIANIIDVDSKYNEAIESALNYNSQAVLVDSVDSISNIRTYLKENILGRVTFFSVESKIKIVDIDSKDNSIFIAKAVDVVKCDKKYEPIMKSLLANTFIVDSFKDIIDNLNSIPDGVRVISLNGDVLDFDKSIKTGAVKKKENTGIIARDKNIKEIEVELKKYSKELENLEINLQEYKDNLNAVKKTIETVFDKIEEQRQIVNNKTTEFQKVSLDMEHNNKIKLEDEQQIIELNNLIKNNKQILISNKEKAVSIQLKIDELAKEENIKKQELTNIEKDRKMQIDLVNEDKIEQASLKEREVSLSNKIETLNKQINEEKQRQQRLKDEFETMTNNRTNLKQEIDKLELSLIEMQKLKDEFDTEINKIFNNKEELVTKNTLDEADLRELRQKYNAIQKQVKELEIKGSESEIRMNDIKERIKDYYDIKIEDILDKELELDMEKQEITEKIDYFKKKIDAMGEVNIFAIDEFTRLEERYEFLDKQNNDLITAKESLRNIISSINKESQKRFKQAFLKINENFKEIFKILFQGGSSELILTDEEDLLDSAIEIKACPPGKKMQSITLLSGGEKALTGIALLFAMFRVNPSPFCILDEVDAPLDDMNIVRFLRIIDEFKKNTQFIIVTHNKQTMSASDIIYGITMEQPGISKVISVNLVENKEESLV